jgi:hypothetical protein
MPSELVQTISEAIPTIATRPVGEAATSARSPVKAVTCVHVWPSVEVQTKAAPLAVPQAA